MNARNFIWTAAAGAAGVFLAGLVMAYGRRSVALIATAHSGYDS